MSDPFLYTYPSPLEGYENLQPLPEELSEDGKSFKNPETGVLSDSYSKFTSGVTNGRRGGFDIHIYYHYRSEYERNFAKALWDRIRREFPELRIYKFWDHPVGPHTLAMFEVNVFTPAQFGAFIPWLVINRGPLSALVHPNTDDGDELRAHSQRATWLGERVPLDLKMLKEFMDKKREQENGTKA
ncbi:hypothetical protein PV11_08217 [Exophiala sideris]|uniref:DOPA 4,5-dioxygenase n=1 Tax=Exophiala sideris TaxID=1016849 RepID=A0A0D1YI63_9EURO|nr:hypothetical protein PV11_08217 [Exophiala sideris]